MYRTHSEKTGDQASITCPACGNWESQGIDDPRKNLNCLPIIYWRQDDEKEVSVHRCSECGEKFEVEWY